MKKALLILCVFISALTLTHAEENPLHKVILEKAKKYSQFSQVGRNHGEDYEGFYEVAFYNCFFNLTSTEESLNLFIAGSYKSTQGAEWDGETGTSTFKAIKVKEVQDVPGEKRFMLTDKSGLKSSMTFKKNGTLIIGVLNYEDVMMMEYDAFTCTFNRR